MRQAFNLQVLIEHWAKALNFFIKIAISICLKGYQARKDILDCPDY